MEETVSTTQTEPRPSPRGGLKLLAGLRENPVIVKEMRARMRGNRAFVLLSAYLLTMVFILSMVYLAFIASNDRTSQSANSLIEARRELGQAIFFIVVGIELFAVCVFTPALTSSAITSEREQQTFDLLKTTLLSARSLVYGKFLSGLIFVLLMLLTSLPLQSLAFLFGGVAPEELLINALILACTAASFCAVGVFCSSLFKTSRMANGAAFAAPLVYVVLVPAFLLILFSIIEPSFNSAYGTFNPGNSPLREALFNLLLWFMISLNPIATIIATEALIVENHSIWVYPLDLYGSVSIDVLSPWILYCLLAALLTVGLLAWSMHLVRRMDT